MADGVHSGDHDADPGFWPTIDSRINSHGMPEKVEGVLNARRKLVEEIVKIR